MQSPKEGGDGKGVKEIAESEKEASAKARGKEKEFGSNRMHGIPSNKIKRDELKPGDHIHSWPHGYLYSHHGIYVGGEKVIHFIRKAGHEPGTGTVLDPFIFSSSPQSSDTPCPRCGDQSKASGVIASCLECFLYGGELYRFEYDVSPRGGTCTLAPFDPVEDVIHRAEFLLQNGFGCYDIFKNNCENFAIYCKTGTIASTLSPTRSSMRSIPGGAAIAFISQFMSNIGIRRNVTKIPVEELVSRSGLDNSNTSSETCSTNASKMTKEDYSFDVPSSGTCSTNASEKTKEDCSFDVPSSETCSTNASEKTKEDYSFDVPPLSFLNTHLSPPTNYNITPSNSQVPDHSSSSSSSPCPPKRPFVPISDSRLLNIAQSWKLALIVKPFGKSLELKILDLKIRNLWQLQGELHILVLGKDFFVTKFDNDADYSHVLSGGPWFIDDYYLSVSTWQPNFNVNEVKQLDSAVWVRLPNLPIEYFDHEILESIGNALGKLLKIDTVTELDKEEGRFARLCILLDLVTPLSSEILIGTYNQRLLYEGLNFFCFSRGCIGHDHGQCKKSPPPTV